MEATRQKIKTPRKSLKPKKITSKQVLKQIRSIMEEKKCEDIVILNLEKVNSYLSIFIIASVNSATQARAVSREIEKSLKEFKLGMGSQDKSSSLDSGWILLDYGEIIVHIMTKDARGYYDLEKLWGDAKKVS